MAGYRLTALALDHLALALDYSVTTFGARQGRKFRDQFIAAFERLVRFPGVGRPVAPHDQVFRRYELGPYTIVYRQIAQEIVVVAIFSSRMDWTLASIGDDASDP